eukprot:m.198402 g.198402  ORF g.198402 m.198402 type:complete len:467 (-) comp15716_c0_seq24:3311-4711(-)
MNLALQDITSASFPEIIEKSLEDGIAVTSAFNRRGSLLAVGCNDGRVVIWDFVTKSIAKQLLGHIETVASVSWSRNGRTLISASLDCSVNVWDVATGDQKYSYKFDGALNSAQVHPRNDKIFVASPHMSAPVLINTTIPDGDPGCRKLLLSDLEEDDLQIGSKSRAGDPGMIAVFSKKGENIYVGTPKGKLIILDTSSLKVIKHFSVSERGGCGIKSIEFSKDGSAFLVNSVDRILRLFKTDGHVIMHEFQDVINRIPWRTCCFSNDGEHVIAGSSLEVQHLIYIWDREGNLLRTIEGPKEGLLHVVWHPVRRVIASTSTHGVVYIWGVQQTENWSAFAPDFKELDENVEYIEREDEFDIIDDGNVDKDREEEETEDVDVVTIDEPHFGSSDEEPIEDELVHIPVNLTIEDEDDEKDPNGATEGQQAVTPVNPNEADDDGLTPRKRGQKSSSIVRLKNMHLFTSFS